MELPLHLFLSFPFGMDGGNGEVYPNTQEGLWLS